MVMQNIVSQRNKYHPDGVEALMARIRQYVPEWMRRASCGLADPGAFQPDEHGGKDGPGARGIIDWYKAGQQVCSNCPVFDDCDSYAVEQGIDDNAVWAGVVRKSKSRSGVNHDPEGFKYERPYTKKGTDNVIWNERFETWASTATMTRADYS